MKTDIGQHIDLKSNEIDKFTPPSHSDKTGEAVTSSTSESLNFYLIRLVRQLLDMAVANTDLSPVDKETLEKLLRYDSVAAIARQKHMTPEAVRLRVVKCMSALTDIINAWQEPSQKISSLQQRIKELEEIVNPQKQLLQIQVEKIRQLSQMDLRLGMDVKWKESIKDFLIRE